MPATASLPQTLTPYHAKSYAYELTRRCPPEVAGRTRVCGRAHHDCAKAGCVGVSRH